MSDTLPLVHAKPRTSQGKGHAFRTRAAGQVPAVLYGRGTETLHIQVEPKPLRKAVTTPFGLNTIFHLQVEGESAPRQVMMREVQKHPVSDELLHIDFQQVADDTPINVKIQLHYVGRPLGVRKGGEMDILRKYIRIKTTPGKLIPKMDVDVDPLDVGTILRIKDVKFPDGVTPIFSDNFALLQIKGKGIAADEPAAPAAGAKAAPGKAAPAKAAAPAAKAPAKK